MQNIGAQRQSDIRRHQCRLASQRYRDRFRAALADALERAKVAECERMQLQQQVAILQQQNTQLQELEATYQQQRRGLQEQVVLFAQQNMQLQERVAQHERHEMHQTEQVVRLLWQVADTNEQLNGSQRLLQTTHDNFMAALDMIEPDSPDSAEQFLMSAHVSRTGFSLSKQFLADDLTNPGTVPTRSVCCKGKKAIKCTGASSMLGFISSARPLRGRSTCARRAARPAPAHPLVPIEDMTDPKRQLENRDVILVCSRDNSLKIRTSTLVLYQHSKQLLSAARDVGSPLPLDCSVATMLVLERLLWGEDWRDAVQLLWNEELLDLFEVANAWQMEVVTLSMPDWIASRCWPHQQLEDLYARSELPDGVHQAALQKLIDMGEVAKISIPRAGDLCNILKAFSLNVRAAVDYLSSANLPLISPDIAGEVLALLVSSAHLFACASPSLKDGQLHLLDALRRMRTCHIPLSEAVYYFASRLDPEAGGVECTSLGSCIEDMLAHYLREAICSDTMTFGVYTTPVPIQNGWKGFLRCLK